MTSVLEMAKAARRVMVSVRVMATASASGEAENDKFEVVANVYENYDYSCEDVACVTNLQEKKHCETVGNLKLVHYKSICAI